jgi:hypothetical protein
VTRRRLIPWLGIAPAVTLAGVLVLPTPPLICLDWLRGEAFYQGRPTCYWSRGSRNWVCVYMP